MTLGPKDRAVRNRPIPKKKPEALIVYGTNRGTTGKIADTISEGLKEKGWAATSISLDLLSLMPQKVEKSDLIGIGSPVYFLREALYLTRFLDGLPSLEGKRGFVFCTTGMDRVGETLHRLRWNLHRKGVTVVGARSFRSAMSYMPYRKRGFGNGDEFPGEKEFTAARSFGERMADAPHLDPVRLEPVSYPTQLKARLLADERLRNALFPRVTIRTKDCTGYGSCLSRCPFQGLDRKDGEQIPFYTGACVQCLDCIPWCPRGAIVPDSRVKDWASTLSYRLHLH